VVTGTVLSFILVHTVYTICAINRFKKLPEHCVCKFKMTVYGIVALKH